MSNNSKRFTEAGSVSSRREGFNSERRIFFRGFLYSPCDVSASSICDAVSLCWLNSGDVLLLFSQLPGKQDRITSPASAHSASNRAHTVFVDL